mgnify:CR=1 FL=1
MYQGKSHRFTIQQLCLLRVVVPLVSMFAAACVPTPPPSPPSPPPVKCPDDAQRIEVWKKVEAKFIGCTSPSRETCLQAVGIVINSEPDLTKEQNYTLRTCLGKLPFPPSGTTSSTPSSN